MTRRRIGVGVDFGTSNSAAATFDGEHLTLLPLEDDPTSADLLARGTEHDAAIMPSATYIDRELQTRTGREAVRRYIADNTRRKVELVPEVVGRATLAVGQAALGSRNPGETLTTDVYGDAVVDVGMQGRLFRGAKRLLGRKEVRRLMVFDHPFRLVALITPILARIRKRLAAQIGAVESACVGHPVHFEGADPFRNQLALSRLGEAYRYAGIPKPRFYPEPIAAAVGYLAAHPEAEGKRLLTLDFGGGTLDFCILERTKDRHIRVLATHGLALGGDHIDQHLFRQLLFPLLGKGERWRRRGENGIIDTLFPFEDYEPLLVNWPVTYLLNQNRYTTAVQDCVANGGPERIKFRRLRELIQQNLGYLVFQAIRDFKARLSYLPPAANGQPAPEVALDIPEIDVDVRLSRPRFEALIGTMLAEVEQGVAQTLQRSRLSAKEIDIVLRTGGSSLIPAVRDILEGFFSGRVVEHDPFTSVAAGLAIADYHGLPAA